ncbi:MAG: S1C family serine protease [Patescibacteria group bacterium]
MKPKITPTSPKVQTDDTDQIEKLYDGTLKTIDKPQSKARFSISWLLIVIIIGFFAGIVGQLALLSFGDRIPWLEKFGLTSGSETSVILTSRNKDRILTAAQVESIAEDLSQSVVRFYPRHDETTGLDAQYLPSEKVAEGFVLTDDGYVAILADALPEGGDYVAITDDGDIYAVERIVRDPATVYAFVQIGATGLTTVGFSDAVNIRNTEEILAIQSLHDGVHQIARTPIIATDYYPMNQSNDFVMSSEQYDSLVLFGQDLDPRFVGSVAFTFDKKALGIITRVGGEHVIEPFERITEVMSDVFSGAAVERPYLGVRYVELDQLHAPITDAIPLEQQGNYIYTTEDVSGVVADSPASAAGLQNGDIITEVDGQPIGAQLSIADVVLAHAAGDTLTLTIVRNGESQKTNVTLATLP